MNSLALFEKFKGSSSLREQGYPLSDFPLSRDKMSRSRVKNMPTAMTYLAQAMGRLGADKIDATELTEENIVATRVYLTQQGKHLAVIQNVSSNLRVLALFATECGVAVPKTLKLERPKKFKTCAVGPDGKLVGLAPKSPFARSDRYSLTYRNWTESQKAEFENLKAFYTDPFADHRNRKMYKPSSMGQMLNVLSRFFGVCLLQGIPKEDLSLELLRDIDRFKGYCRYRRARNAGKDTEPTKKDLTTIQTIVRSYFQDNATAIAMSDITYGKHDFKKQKDAGELVRRIHPDQLYTMCKGLIANAQRYETKSRRNRRVPQVGLAGSSIMAGVHWMRAAMITYTVVTWLRESNVALATQQNIYKKGNDWHFTYTAAEMKGEDPYANQVIDLWEGDAFQPFVNMVLDKAAEYRPMVIEHYLSRHPGQEAPAEFFLNEDCKGYSPVGVRKAFYSESQRYLSWEFKLFPHSIRTIVPSWLLVREGEAILLTIQHCLCHRSIVTTQQYYLKVKKIFSSQLAKLHMEERDKHRKMLARLDKLPQELEHMVHKLSEEFRETMGTLDPEAISAMIQATIARALDERKGPDGPLRDAAS